ncbi:MAG: hypothetical protein DMF64_06710 [Acidobacteria bacterium]|nr:MAG: hypothetical protein DMF64_06710 [Acidobacteriota bacterium]
MRYSVLVADNFHYMDEVERYQLGEFHTAEAALAAARCLVDDELAAHYQPGMSANELYRLYTSFGVDPFIVSADGDCHFSAWDYARGRCQELCRAD